MRIREEIARHHWERAAVEEARTQYASEGYEVQEQVQLGKFQADLVARSGDEMIVVEFKAGPWNPQKAQAVQQLRKYVVHELGAQFNLVWAAPPREREIHIEGIEQAFLEQFIHSLPSELDALSTHTQVEEVSDLFIRKLWAEPGKITIAGEAVVGVELIYGSDSDEQRGDGARMSDNYPFEFKVILNSDLEIIEVLYLNIDTASFYE
jgi:hypothetical protein